MKCLCVSTTATLRALAICAALLQPVSVCASTLTVSNISEVFNGDTTNPDALNANPGPDGISLVEAMAAVRGSPGPHTITFAPALMGQTIRLSRGLQLAQDGVTILGPTNPDGSLGITLDGTSVSSGIVLDITASNVSVSHIRFINIRLFAISIRAGARGGPNPPPQIVNNIQVSDNAFDNGGFPNTHCLAISVGMEAQASNANLGDVTIARNTIANFTGEANGIHIQAGGTNNVVHDIVVSGNTFTNVTFGVELVPAQASGSQIKAVEVVANTFTRNSQPVNLNAIGNNGKPATSGNVVDGTQVRNNVFANNRGPAIAMLGGMTNAAGNVITNTTIANNVIYGSTTYGGVAIVAGRTGASENRIDGVSIVNNTIARNVGGGVIVNADPERAGGNNTSSGIAVFNSIVVDNDNDRDVVGTSQVSFSLIGQSGFAGVNGNISGDPRFVNPALGDFHLQGVSPAIDAASSQGAPLTDLDGYRRIDDLASPNRGSGSMPYYDMGAYEFGSAPAAPPTVTVAAPGPITNRTISISVTPPASLLNQAGSVFVVARLPPSLGGRVYVMTENGGWSPATGCDSAAAAYSGRLTAGVQLSVVSTPADLSRLNGTALSVGYGVGPTVAVACTDMLNYSTITSVYTID